MLELTNAVREVFAYNLIFQNFILLLRIEHNKFDFRWLHDFYLEKLGHAESFTRILVVIKQ